MNRYLILVFYIFVIGALLMPESMFGGDVRFITSLADAKKQAAEQNKLIFVDVMADWCRPCKKMMADLRANDAACDFFNQHYVNLKINEKYNKTFLNEYNIQGFPTLMFLNADGEVLWSVTGYPGIDHLVSMARKFDGEKDLYKSVLNISEETFDEVRFIDECSKKLAQFSPEMRNKNIQKYLEAGEPYRGAVIRHFGSLVSYPLFYRFYDRDKYPELHTAEQFMVSFLMYESNFYSNDKIRKGSKEIARLTGLTESKVNTFMICYKEFAILRQIGLTNDHNLEVFAKNLLKNYPETRDFNLLYDAMVTVILQVRDKAFYAELEAEFENLAQQNPHCLYYDFLSVIYAKQGKNEEAALAVSKASKWAGENRVLYSPFLTQYRKEILK